MTAFLFAVFSLALYSASLALFALALLVVAWAGIWARYFIEEGLYRYRTRRGLWRGMR